LDETASVEYQPAWLGPADKAAVRAELDQLRWQQESIRMWGEPRMLPRLTVWLGIGWTAESRYRARGFAHDWTPTIAAVRDRLVARTGVPFNSVLVNQYRDGSDSVGWHADDEPEIDQACVASVTLGGRRAFRLRSRADSAVTYEVPLGDGDLLLMHDAQARWVHSVPRTARPVPVRHNLTFRHYLA
jgi:alkylated DNA repair dioxygenase AlkB